MSTASSGSDTGESPDVVLRIDPQVRRQRSPTGREYLSHGGTGRVVQVGGMSSVILDRLARGVTLRELVADIERTYAGAGPKITVFVEQLVRAGMLDNAPSQVRSRYIVLAMPNPDSFARAVATALVAVGSRIRWTLLLGFIAASLSLVVMVITGGGLQVAKQLLDPYALVVVIFLPVFSLIHELAHAVAARFVGIPIVAAGILIRPWRATASFVRTDSAVLLLSRAKRIQICLAGPVADLFTLGGISAVLLVARPASPWSLILSLAFILKAAALVSNLSPLQKSDVSDALGALFDDYRIRRVALRPGVDAVSAHAPHVRSYRVASAFYVFAAGAFWVAIIVAIFSKYE